MIGVEGGLQALIVPKGRSAGGVQPIVFAFVEKHGGGLAQFLLNAMRPCKIEDGMLNAGLIIRKIESDHASGQPLLVNPLVESLKLLFLFLARNASDSPA